MARRASGLSAGKGVLGILSVPVAPSSPTALDTADVQGVFTAVAGVHLESRGPCCVTRDHLTVCASEASLPTEESRTYHPQEDVE